jgi:hypothetical protein
VDEFFKKGGSNMARAFGKTDPSDWKQAPGIRKNSLYVDVKLPTTAGFDNDPAKPIIYTTSIGGDNQHWALVGANAVYKATHTGFRVYIRWFDFSELIPEYAEQMNWHINWIAMQEP